MIQSNHNASLVRFLVLSSGLHFIFLLGIDRPVETRTIPHLGQRVLNVAIQNSPSSIETQPEKTFISRSPEKEKNNIYHTTRSEKYTAPQSDLSVKDIAQKTERETAATMHIELRNQLLGELQTRLARYLVYPPLARKYGWEGTVLVGLRVESDGHLEKLRVERSSGYAVLDHSALNALYRLGHLAEASLWLDGHGMDVQLPVIYQLIEN
ncbi:MAG: TonB family protein [Sulfuricaulis sp.]|nr:TonB family protein [Sulfuricaulis sp.]